MSAQHPDPDSLPDLLDGIPSSSVPRDGSALGRVGDVAVLVVRTDGGLRAVQASCPHYGAPLADGCVRDGRIHCPWHHASFDLDDGFLRRPPALDSLKSWEVEEQDGSIRLRTRAPQPAPTRKAPSPSGPIVLIGAGAAGTAAAVTLRQAGHEGAITLLDPDPAAPYDRPNLSKDYLAGTAPEEWLPLLADARWTQLGIERVVDRATAIDPSQRFVETGGGRRLPFDGLVLATGASPRLLDVPGADDGRVRTLRSLDDCRTIRSRAESAHRCVIVGAGFLGLEVAASLRSLEVDVCAVAPEDVPLGRVLGPELGGELRALHEEHGVRFHLGRTVEEIGPKDVLLDDGTRLEADLILVAIGVDPRTGLASDAGFGDDDGVAVDTHLQTEVDGIYAAGDIARFPHPHTRESMRIEHWAVAEAQGRTAALNLLGHRTAFHDIPFFWTAHYGVTVQWSGYPLAWDRIERDGSLSEGSLRAHYLRDDREVAAAFVGREREGLRWELAMADNLPTVGG